LWNPQTCGPQILASFLKLAHTLFMSSSSDEKNLKSEVAKEKPRDEHGHFIKSVEEVTGKVAKISHNALDDEKLVDISVNNPLNKIYRLLEQIKQQKAFAFTLKGSLGLAGVAVALTVFGLFGGSKILCDKGNQTEIGIIKVLKTQEPDGSEVPFMGFIIDNLKEALGTQTTHNRTILQTGASSAIHLPYNTRVDFLGFNDREVYATGNFDNCSRVLKVKNLELTH
jgi:hypothetical protein